MTHSTARPGIALPASADRRAVRRFVVRWWAGIALAAGLAGCAVETPPSIPGAPERRAAVVPARRAEGAVGRPGAGGASCAASCPPPRDGEELAGCHPSQLDRRGAAHRGAPGEPPDEWVVCYFEAR